MGGTADRNRWLVSVPFQPPISIPCPLIPFGGCFGLVGCRAMYAM